MLQDHSNLFLVLIFWLMFTLFPADLMSQSRDNGLYSFEFSGVTLALALEEIAGKTEADLIYDPAIVEGFNVYQRIREKTIPEILKQVLKDTGLDYIILSSGTFVVVKSSLIASSYGSLTGKVVDAQTGDPLPGATVMLADVSGGTSTNNAGLFNLNRMLTGRHEIIFSYIGYEPVRKEITIAPDQDVRESIRMQPRQFDVSPIVVTAHKPLLSFGHTNEETIDRLSDWNTGSRSPDAIQSMALFSGIQYGLPLTDLHLQGGQRGDHRIFLDGIPVYNPYSFGQLYSAFSPYSLDRVSVEKAGFGVESGSLIAGKIDMRHHISNRNNKRALLQVDPVNTNARIQLSNSNGDESRFHLMTAFRSTFWDWYQDPTLSGALQQWDLVDPLIYNILLNESGGRSFQSVNNASGISYYDFHLASRYEPDPYRTLSFSLYKGENRVETDLLASDKLAEETIYMFSRDSYNWENLATQLRYDWLASPRLNISFQASYSSNELNHSYTMFDNESIQSSADGLSETELFEHLSGVIETGREQRDSNLIRHFIGRMDLNYAFTPRFSLSSGLQSDRVESRFGLTDFFYLPTLNDYQSTFYSSYINGNWVFGSHMKFMAGSRFTILSPSGDIYAEPRMSIQYDQPESSLGYWSLKLSGGIYRQFINQFDITNVGPSSLVPGFTVWAHDSSFEQPKAYHTALSFLLEPGETTSLSIEKFLKIQPSSYITSYPNLMVGGGDVSRTGLDAFAEVTDMYSYGIGARFRQSLTEARLRLLLGYDFTVSRINMESQFGRMVPTPWNEPHRFQVRLTGRISANTRFAARWLGIYGRSWAFRQAYYDFMVPHNFPSAGHYDFTNPEHDRLSPFHQLDFSFIYTPNLGPVDLETRLDLINVLNRRNSIDWNLFPSGTGPDGEQQYEIRERTLPGFNPSVSLKINF